MTSDLRALLESALQPDTPAVSRRPNARQVLEGCWPEIRDAVAPKCAGILRDALGPLAKSNEEPESKAARLALAREEAFQQAFLTALQAELRQAIAQFCAAAGTEREGGQKALTLVGYDEMELATVMESGAARLRNACDEDFTRLKLRLANLVREPDLRDADVPWRPVIFLRAAYLGLERSGIAGPDLLALTKRFDAALAAPAAAAYAALDRHLAGQGISAEVLAASREGAKGPRTGGSRRQAENAGGASRARAGLSAEQLLQALVERLLPLAAAGALKTSGAAAESDLSPTPTAAAAAGAAGGSRFVTAATGGGLTAGQIDAALLHALDEAQRLNALAIAAILKGQTGPAPGAVDAEQLRAQVAEKAARQVDRLTIELVGLLFDRINQDKHVPPAIKNLLHRLQFPLIKVALTDPQLFLSPQQPARALLDRIAATSVGWDERGAHNQRYLAEVRKAVQTVLSATEQGLAPFQRALEGFEKYLEEESARDDDPVARARRALAEAEQREVMAINAMIKIRSVFDGVQLESYLREFLLETWTRVLVEASLREHSEPGLMRRLLSVVPDLVWSVQPKLGADERRRLVATIPPVLTALREGLRLIDWPQEKVNAFFGRLMNSHAQAVKALELAHGAAPPAVEVSTLRIKLDGLQLASDPIAAPPAGEELPVNDDMVKHALALNRAEVNHLTAEHKIPPGEDAQLDRQIAGFRRGDWFDLRIGGRTERVQLRWFTPRRALYLFAAPEGARTHSLTPATLRQYLREGRIAPVEGVPLFDRALREMLDELQRMSGEAVPAGR